MNNKLVSKMGISKIFFFVISLFGIIPAIYQITKGKRTVAEFINNDRNFSTFQLSMTLIATAISLGGVNVMLQKSYSDGLNYFLPTFFGSLLFYILMMFIVPRLTIFFEKNYFGDAISAIAGGYAAKIISAVICFSALLMCIGQFKVGINSAYFLSFEQKRWFLWMFGIIIALYIAYGGISSVVNSDIIQLFLAFGAVIIILILGMCYIKFDQQLSARDLTSAIKSDLSNFKFDLTTLNVLLIMAIPTFSPAYTSRFFIAKNAQQSKLAFIWLGVGWLSLITLLYLIAKVIGVNNAQNTIQTLDIATTLRSLKIVEPSIILIFLISIFMFAVTTIDSLVQFVTVEIATLITKDPKKISRLFVILPILLIFIICAIAQDDSNWQSDYHYIFNLTQTFTWPIVAPIIWFYCLFKTKFAKSTIPIIAIIIGSLVTFLIYKGFLGESLNPGFVGAIINLVILIIFKNHSQK